MYGLTNAEHQISKDANNGLCPNVLSVTMGIDRHISRLRRLGYSVNPSSGDTLVISQGKKAPRFMQYYSKDELSKVIDLTKLTPSKRQKLLSP